MEAYEQPAGNTSEGGAAQNEDATNDNEGTYLQSAGPADPSTGQLELLTSAALSSQACPSWLAPPSSALISF
jgi:hypothetical protein